MSSGSLLPLASIVTEAPPVPFNPRPMEWIAFTVIVLLIIVIYVVRYLRSNRQTHRYILRTDGSEEEGAEGPEAGGSRH